MTKGPDLSQKISDIVDGRITSVSTSDASGAAIDTTTIAYDAKGRPSSSVDAQNKTTLYAYQAADGTSLGFATGSTRTVLTHEDGTTEITERGCCGPLTVTDRAGAVTDYTYDQAGRVATETRDGITTTHTYDAQGRETQTGRQGTDASDRPFHPALPMLRMLATAEAALGVYYGFGAS